jgi:hypothetical protein
VSECDREASIMSRPWSTMGCCARGEGGGGLYIYIYIGRRNKEVMNLDDTSAAERETARNTEKTDS